MQTVIQNYLDGAKIGRKQSHRNLAMYPLLSSYTVGLEYITLDEALSRGLIEVVERDEAGSVPETQGDQQIALHDSYPRWRGVGWGQAEPDSEYNHFAQGEIHNRDSRELRGAG